MGVTCRRTYEITVSGRLGELASAFEPHSVRSEGSLSFVHVEHVDQGTLFGLIRLVQDLGLELREVRLTS